MIILLDELTMNFLSGLLLQCFDLCDCNLYFCGLCENIFEGFIMKQKIDQFI